MSQLDNALKRFNQLSIPPVELNDAQHIALRLVMLEYASDLVVKCSSDRLGAFAEIKEEIANSTRIKNELQSKLAHQ